MKISAGNHLDIFALYKDQRIVCHRIQFKFQKPFCICDRVAAGAMDLRHTAERIGVLDIRGIEISTKLAPAEDLPQILRTLDLARMRPKRVNSFIKGRDSSMKGFQRQTPGDIGDLSEPNRPRSFKQAERG